MAVSSPSVAAGSGRASRGWAIAAGVPLIIGGLGALAAPYIAALFVTLLVAWGLIFGAIAELISAYSASENRAWKVLIGLLYLGVGVYMLLNPGAGLLALALVIAWVFLVQGAFSLFGAIQLRPLPGWGWWLFDGIVTLLLALLIFSGWPGGSVRIVALLVGISLIISGANRLALAFAR